MKSKLDIVIHRDLSFPEEKIKAFGEMINYSLSVAAQELCFSKKIIIYLSVNNKSKNIYDSNCETNKKLIYIVLSNKYLNSRKIYKGLPSTLIHEYTHFVRGNLKLHRNKNILNSMIEEGISVYIQTKLSSDIPTYLTTKPLSKEEANRYWQVFEKILLLKRNVKKQYKKIQKNYTYHTLYYRLGFEIVNKYIKSHKNLTLRQIARLNNEKIAQFAIKEFSKIEKI